MPSSISTPSVANSDSKPGTGSRERSSWRTNVQSGWRSRKVPTVLVDQPPEQDRLVDLIPLVLGEVADLVLERPQVVAEEQRLVEEEREVVRPAEPLDAAHEGRGMADQRDHLRVEARGEPLAREDRDRILQQRPRPARARLAAKSAKSLAVRPTSRGVRIVASWRPRP